MASDCRAGIFFILVVLFLTPVISSEKSSARLNAVQCQTQLQELLLNSPPLNLQAMPAQTRELLDDLLSDGLKGKLINIDVQNFNYSGYYFLINQLPSTPRLQSKFLFLRDSDALEEVSKAKRNAPIAVFLESATLLEGGMATKEHDVARSIAMQFKADSKECMILTPYSDFFRLKHEAAHLSDNQTGILGKVTREIQSKFANKLSEKEQYTLQNFLIEQRGYFAEMVALEFKYLRNAGPQFVNLGGRIVSLPFASFYSKRRAEILKSFQDYYASRMENLLMQIEKKDSQLLNEIKAFMSDFAAGDPNVLDMNLRDLFPKYFKK
ncbi:MAG: hypothetical protein JWQ35_1617 [Bacteriovoracaceae bacterium]|nr:hypothetical protein [Bacteriovoracaceae bacterium]